MTRNALITGCSSGIGRAITKALLADGWSVVGVSRTAPNISGPAFRHIKANVGDRATLKLRLQAFLNEFPLDAVIHCAGNQGEIGTVEDSAPPWWAQTVEENLIGAYYVVHYALPYLHMRDESRILLFSGGGAHDPFPNYSAYAVSKAGVVRLMETLAVELAPSISVNCVAPGFIATPIHDATRKAGIEKAGAEQWLQVYDGRSFDPVHTAERMDRVVACVNHLLDPETKGLTGRTISVTHDPWPALDSETVPFVVGGTTTRLPLSVGFDARRETRDRERVLL